MASSYDYNQAGKLPEKLPPDTIFDILLRLRVKTLCRFRCVSKSWYTLISDPVFQQSYERRSKENPLIFITTLDNTHRRGPRLVHHQFNKESRTLDFVMSFAPGQHIYPPANVFNCFNLVCTYDGDNIYVCNPAVNRWIVLPNYSLRYDSEVHRCQYVAMEYVASISEYKVLRVLHIISYEYDYSSSSSYEFEVLTLGQSHWRAIERPPLGIELDFNVGMAIVDGAIYFWGVSRDYDGIIQLDLKEEDWSLIPIPDDHEIRMAREKFCFRISLRQVGGLLCLVRNVERFLTAWSPDKLEIWLMKNANGYEWVKECCIDVSMFRTHVFLLRDGVIPLAIEQDGRVLFRMGNRLQYYDPKSRRFEEIYAGKHDLTISFYIESFRSLSVKRFKIQSSKKKKKSLKPFRMQENSIPIKNQFSALDDAS